MSVCIIHIKCTIYEAEVLMGAELKKERNKANNTAALRERKEIEGRFPTFLSSKRDSRYV